LETNIQEKDKSISQLAGKLDETLERLELVQRIIQEKDDHIRLLQEKLSEFSGGRIDY